MIKFSLKNNYAMTLIEVLVAVFVLTVGILGSLMFFTQAMKATESAQDLTVATTHAESIFEEMRTRPSLANIQQTDWSNWSASFNQLPSEQIDVTYGDPNEDPLKIDVTVHWARGGRAGNVKLTTEMTK